MDAGGLIMDANEVMQRCDEFELIALFVIEIHRDFWNTSIFKPDEKSSTDLIAWLY